MCDNIWFHTIKHPCSQSHFISQKWHYLDTEELSTLASNYVLALEYYQLTSSTLVLKRSQAAGGGESPYPWQQSQPQY